jgi:hypothetical protein
MLSELENGMFKGDEGKYPMCDNLAFIIAKNLCIASFLKRLLQMMVVWQNFGQEVQLQCLGLERNYHVLVFLQQ